MSLSMELAQYYVPGRVTSFSDLATNTLGMVLGSFAAIVVGAGFRMPFIGDVAARPAPSLLVLAWLAYRLYPYVPTIDLHKYWNALKPIVLTPSLTGYDLFRQTAIWLTVYALIEAIMRRRRSAVMAPLFAIAVLCAKVLIVGIVIRLADPVGAGLAFGVWLLLLLLPRGCGPARLASVLCAYVVALRLEPFTFQAVGREFGWMPFRSLMQGSLSVDTLAFLEKFFLYGSMIYLLGDAFGRRLPAAVITGRAAVRDKLGGGLASRAIGRDHRYAHGPDRGGDLRSAACLSEAPGQRRLLRGSGARERRLRDWQREQARALGVEVDEGR